MRKNMWYLSFYLWLISIDVMNSGLMDFTASAKLWFLATGSWLHNEPSSSHCSDLESKPVKLKSL